MLLWFSASEQHLERYFPFGSLLLVTAFIVTFFTLQIHDYQYKEEAINYYFKADLDKIEFPLYGQFARENMREDRYYHYLESISSQKISNIEIYWMQRLDPLFQKCLNSDQYVAPTSLRYLKWQENRREYLRMVDKIGIQKYGFKTAEPSFFNLLSNLFVQASFLQFITNLVMMIAIGPLLELRIGCVGILLSYFLCGIICVSNYALLAPFGMVPISGASGGVAGLLGMFLVFFLNAKIKYCYWTLRNFKCFEAKIFYVVLFWVLLQCLALKYTSFDSVNFIAQSIGFIGGILLAILIERRVTWQKSKSIIEYKVDDFDFRFKKAVEAISVSNYSEAKNIFYDLLKEYPTNKEIHFQLFNITKFNPASEEYHSIVQRIFSIRDSAKSTTTMINLVFKNYVRCAQPTIRFDMEIFMGLLRRFRKAGYLEDAEKILKVLVKHNHDYKLSEMLAREQLLLARGYLLKNDTVQGYRLLDWLVDVFPQSESAKQVKEYSSHKHLKAP